MLDEKSEDLIAPSQLQITYVPMAYFMWQWLTIAAECPYYLPQNHEEHRNFR